MLKKILAFFVCFNLITAPAFCIISDDFAEKTLSGKMLPKTVQYQNIQDPFAESNKNKNQYTKLNILFDEQPVTTSRKINPPRKRLITEVENSIPVKLQIKKYLSTKHKIDEGDYLEFKTLTEVQIKDKIYPAGTIVQARVETLSRNKIWGVPSDLVVGSFSIDGQALSGEINKIGANRSLWLYPTVYSTTIFFGVGLLLIPIRGGHAKIKPHQVYTVHYLN